MSPHRQPLSLYSQCLLHISQKLNAICVDTKVSNDLPSLSIAVLYVQRYLPLTLQAAIGETIMDDYNRLQLSPHPSLVEMLLLLRSRTMAIGGYVVQSGVMDEADASHLQRLSLSYGGNGDTTLRLHTFLQTASFLTHLQCIDFCNDTMMQIIASNCHNLYCIDLRACDVTNEGILSLCGLNYNLAMCIGFISKGIPIDPASRCSRSLREIKLSMTKVTEAGVAVILFSLKSICLLRVPDIRMEQVFNFLKTIKQTRVQINLKEFHSREMLDDQQLNVLTNLCPNLEYIQVSFLGNFEDDMKRLNELTKLHKLCRAKFADVDMDALEVFLQDIGKRMKGLHIYDFHGNSARERSVMTRRHLRNLPYYCPNLENICLEGYCFEEVDSISHSQNNPLEYFQSLRILKITSMKLAEEDLKVFLAKCNGMKDMEVHLLSPHALHDGLVNDLLDKGVWKNLIRMQVKNSAVTCKSILRLLNDCPYLEVLGCLGTWFVTQKQVLHIKETVRLRNLATDIY